MAIKQLGAISGLKEVFSRCADRISFNSNLDPPEADQAIYLAWHALVALGAELVEQG